MADLESFWDGGILAYPTGEFLRLRDTHVRFDLEASTLVLAILFFFGAYFFLWDRVGRVTALSSLSVKQKHELINVLVSLLNSSLQSVFSVWLLWAFAYDPNFYAGWVRLWIMVFAGYNIYDTICCFFYDMHIFKLVPQLIPHHIIVTLSLLLGLWVKQDLLFYMVFGAICEIHSVSLHIRNVLRIIRPLLSWIRWPNECLNVINYVVCRYLSSVWLCLQAIVQFEDRGWLWVTLTITMWMINNAMGYHILRGYIRDYKKYRKDLTSRGSSELSTKKQA